MIASTRPTRAGGSPPPPLVPAPEPAASLLELLERVAREAPGVGIRFVGPDGAGRRLTWKELLERVHVSAAALEAAGVGSGDRVALLLPTGPELIILFFATVLVGGAAVTLPPGLPFGRVQGLVARMGHILDDARPRIVVATDELRAAHVGEARADKEN